MDAIINAYLNERLSYRELLRTLISSDDWYIPASEQEGSLHPSLLQNNGRYFLSAYTTKENIPKDLLTLQKDGVWIFANLHAPIEGLIIDPQSSHALQFPSSRFPNLKKWAKAIEVERILEKQNFDAQFATCITRTLVVLVVVFSYNSVP